ncbi:MAG TPA: inorganic phosphate transporter [Terracidiphilus sp.]|jgi:PiT family inorganic phosphate transporter|nr:inorganic phosphate transporter [Terracidiphilus sp.]
MADLATVVEARPARKSLLDGKMKESPSKLGIVAFLAALLGGLGFIAFHVSKDLDNVVITSVWPYVLLALALIIALGFEFVNGFHDTANAVATVIYTHSLSPNVAVVLSGICNLAGVLLSSGTVAFAVITLLPVELILQVSSGAGFAMVFALLIAAILWNLGTWWLGLPASSSHTMVGSIIGVGLANQLLSPHGGASGLDWQQVVKVLKALLISPVLGFALAGILILASKRLIKFPSLYEAPKDNQPPPFPIRALMVLTCTGVSFFHGSNDGQKGMGLIMLILIGTVPTAYALNHAVSPMQTQDFIAASQYAGQILDEHVDKTVVPSSDPRAEVTAYIRTQQLQPATIVSVKALVENVNREVVLYKAFKSVPAKDQTNVRNDMYLTSEALRLMAKNHNPGFTATETAALNSYKSKLDKATRFIPDWVKVAVALALGLGTMVGWKRVVITVGEKIGKDHLTYAQGACAGIVTMATIFAADQFGLPVSTTHILSSGVAGTMSASGSGLRMSTVRNIAAGWVFTMPAAALLSCLLYMVFRTIS